MISDLIRHERAKARQTEVLPPAATEAAKVADDRQLRESLITEARNHSALVRLRAEASSIAMQQSMAAERTRAELEARRLEAEEREATEDEDDFFMLLAA